MQNTIIDERGSFAVTSPFPGRLGVILKSLKKVVYACRIYIFSFRKENNIMQFVYTFAWFSKKSLIKDFCPNGAFFQTVVGI